MIRLLLFLAFALLPLGASATSLPALYDVINVAPDDVLNIRLEPTHEAEIIGAFAPNRGNIEILEISDNQKWGKVNINERTGWTSLAYLARHPEQDWGIYPKLSRCFGTEPFWGMSFQDDTLEFNDPNTTTQIFHLGQTMRSGGRLDRHAFLAHSGAENLHAVLSQEACTDWMTERDFGWRIDMILSGADRTITYNGCCTLEPPQH